MEELVGRRRGAQQIVLEASVRDPFEDGLAGALLAPLAPLDEQHPAGMWVGATNLVEHLTSGHPGHPLAGQHQGDVLSGRRQVCEAGECLVG